jgi:hypothetical protein
MANFTNFEQQVGLIRIEIDQQINNLFKEAPYTISLDCKGEGLSISSNDGTQDVTSIDHNNDSGVTITTDSNEVHDLMDLDTDDMVAIYENVWYQLKEK